MFKKIPSLKLSFKKKFFFLLFYQASNPYIGKLSILDDELALNVCITKNSKEKFQKLLISFCVFVFATFRQAGPVQLKSGFLTLCEKFIGSLTSPLLTGDAADFPQ